MKTIATTVSSSEVGRLAKLAEYQILDTAPEQEFDEITEIAAKLIGTPISLVSLIDKDRQWFKARYGLGVTETPRGHAFCAHAIKADDVYVVGDATQDPLVTGNPNIRFYAGAPLITPDKFRLGTLCVIDTAPRDGLAEDARRILTLLAKMVVNQMESRRNTVRATHQARMMRQLADHTVTLAQAKDMVQLARLLTESARKMVVADAATLHVGEHITTATREGVSSAPPPGLPWSEPAAALRARKVLKPATLKDLPAPEIVIKGAWMGFLLGLDAQNPLGDFQVWRELTTSFTDLEVAMLTDLVRVAGAVAERLATR